MFAKIKNNFLNVEGIDFTQFKSSYIVDSYYSISRKGGSVLVLIKDLEKFWKLHTRNIFTITPVVRYVIFTGTGLVTPHTDGGTDSVALNFYLTAPGDATIFYEKKHPNVKPYPNSNGYNVNDLNEVSRFCANRFDMYLMNVQQIHGIEKQTDENRILISYRWQKFTFDQIYQSLDVEKILWNEL